MSAWGVDGHKTWEQDNEWRKSASFSGEARAAGTTSATLENSCQCRRCSGFRVQPSELRRLHTGSEPHQSQEIQCRENSDGLVKREALGRSARSWHHVRHPRKLLTEGSGFRTSGFRIHRFGQGSGYTYCYGSELVV